MSYRLLGWIALSYVGIGLIRLCVELRWDVLGCIEIFMVRNVGEKSRVSGEVLDA